MSISPLSPHELDELVALERRVAACDAVALKLEWPSLREGRTAASLAHRERDGALTGFLGLYAFAGPPDVELTGMVDPRHRRRGIATRLLQAGLEVCAQQRLSRRLLVVPREHAAAQAFATRHATGLEHSEHSLELTGEPRRHAPDPATTVRPATAEDRADRRRILAAGFGSPAESMLDALSGPTFTTVIVEHHGVPVGTARLTLDAGVGAIHGFAVDPELRGRGIGRDALGRFAISLRERGAERVRLEVAVENERALWLYTSTGFVPVGTEDYFRLPVSSGG